MNSTLSHLASVRSLLAEQIESYCTQLIDKLDRTPWANIRVSEIGVPVRVLKESTRQESPGSERDGPNDHRNSRDPERRESSRQHIDPESARFYEEPTGEKRREEVPWLAEYSQVRRAILLGGPGSGKSFLTQITGIDLARTAFDAVHERTVALDSLSLPIHCTLTRFADPKLPPDPLKALIELVKSDFALDPCFLPWLEQRLSANTTWLVLDALDEVPENHRPALIDRLRALDSQAWQARVLLTRGPANWSRGLIPWSILTEYELAPLNPVEIHQFVERWHAADHQRGHALNQALDRNYPLAHAARTPLIATFLCLAHEEKPVDAATRRNELYARVLRALARRAWKEPELQLSNTNPHVDDLVHFLVTISRPLFELHPAGNLFTNHELMMVLRNVPSDDRPPASVCGQQKTNSTFDLRAELIETGILAGAGLRDGVETQFSFAHRSLLEYLVSRNLSAAAKAKGWESIASFVDKKSWHPAWQETVVFLSGLLDDPVPLLVLLANANKDDATRQRLCLAGRCLPELSAAARETCRGKPRDPARRDVGQPAANLRVVLKIPREILELWWNNGERGTPFTHVSNVLSALGSLGAEELQSELLERLQDKDVNVRRRAADALGRMGPAAATEAVLSTLVEWLRDPECFVRSRAADALGKLGPVAATEAVLSTLVEWLRDSEADVWYSAADALGEYLRSGVRWFPKPRGRLKVTTVEELSGEKPR